MYSGKRISGRRVRAFFGVLLSLCMVFTLVPILPSVSVNAVSAKNAVAAVYRADNKTVVKYYSSLQGAINGITYSARSVRLLKNTTLKTPVTANRNYRYTINLRGHSLKGRSTSALINVTKGRVGIAQGTITNTGGGAAVSENGGTAMLPEGYSGSISDSSLKSIPNAHFLNLYTSGSGSQTMNGSSWTEGHRFIRTVQDLNAAFTPSDTANQEVSSLSVNQKSVGKKSSYTVASSSWKRDYSFSIKYGDIAYDITAATYMGSDKNTMCGKISPSGTTSVGRNDSQSYTISVNDGYKLDDVKVDGVSQGAITSYTFSGVNENHTITANYTKTSVFIMIDPGHYNHYNKGCISGYYEGNQMWKLSTYLVNELKEYPGIIVSRTKSSLGTYEPGVYSRGLKAKGYDFFLSLHSNSSESSYSDYPLAIVSSGSTLYKTAKPLGKSLVKDVESMMDTNQDYQIWIKKQHDGRDWYGVIRGAAYYNVPAVILEHSFHSNRASAKWLMSSSNLKKMAVKEATTIANYYGLSKTGSVASPKKPTGFKLTVKGSHTIKASWTKSVGATGYRVYRLNKSTGHYNRIATTSGSSYTDRGLSSKTKYTYKIKAYRTSGSKTAVSSSVSSKSATTK